MEREGEREGGRGGEGERKRQKESESTGLNIQQLQSDLLTRGVHALNVP